MTALNKAKQAALDAAKARAAEVLTRAGHPSSADERVTAIIARARRVLGERLGGESSADYLNRIAQVQLRRRGSRRSGVIAGNRTPAAFQPMEPSPPHPRQAEIDALPTPVSMPWDGHGNWTDGARW